MLKQLFNVDNKSFEYSGETIDILRLIRSENVGPKTFFSLIKLFGSATKALDNIGELSLKGGRSKPIKVFAKQDALREIEELNKNKSFLISYKDSRYSELLKHIPDCPPILTYKGNINLLSSEKVIALVGARNCSINGRKFTQKITQELIAEGFTTVSGLARGIDAVVHETSIEQTIAVIAGGIDHIYPEENTKLFHKIAESGLIVAELPIRSKPLSQHFPMRNRIIAGLALATIVIEAGIKSGSLITANQALDYNREIFAMPGFPLDPRSMGANKLIKGGAYLLESGDDVINNINSYKKMKKSLEEYNSCDNFRHISNDNVQDITDKDRQNIISLLSSTPVSIETLSDTADLPMPVIYTICVELELAGKIARYPGNKIGLLY